MAGGLLTIAMGALVAAILPLAGTAWAALAVYAGALLVGAGIGFATPIAFAHLADSTPHERMGRTMGSAELGRELGDSGGPLLVGAVATGAGIGWGLGALAAVVVVIAAAAPSQPAGIPDA
jgi:MFS family permease